MYSKLDVWLLEKANWAVRNCPVIKPILKPIYYPYKNWRKQMRNKEFMSNALYMLKEFTDCLEVNNCDYTLAYGSLLGAVREKGFIKHDYDIDVFVWYDRYTPDLVTKLKAIGFDLVHEFSVDNGKTGLEHTYLKNGVSIDIFFIYPAVNQLPYNCSFVTKPGSSSFKDSQKRFGGVVPVRYEAPFNRSRHLIQFENLELYIPDNSDELLKVFYGPNYMTPNPNWVEPQNNPYRIVWNEKNAIYKE